MIEVRNLSCGYGKYKVLENVSFSAKQGDVVCILGANGSGKSTLIKSILGLIDMYDGDIFVDGVNIKNWEWGKRGKLMSYIPQVFGSTFQYRAIDIILMGRSSYIPIHSSPSRRDIEIAKESMEKLNIIHLKNKIYSQMSGGERQLVKIAQALAQQSKIIVMDEPTNNLDFTNQISILSFLKDCSNMGITILMATHYPQQALYYGTKALLLNNKNVVEIDKPNENLTTIERVIIACTKSSLDRVILIYRKEEIKEIAKRYGIKAIENKNAHIGQSESMKLGIKNTDDNSSYMFIVGDQPLIDYKTINRLIKEHKSSNKTITIPYYNGKRGMPGIISRVYKDELLEATGDKGGRDLIKRYPENINIVNIEEEMIGIDIDSNEDIDRLNDLLKNKNM